MTVRLHALRSQDRVAVDVIGGDGDQVNADANSRSRLDQARCSLLVGCRVRVTALA
jgi:hypothetical protein